MYNLDLMQCFSDNKNTHKIQKDSLDKNGRKIQSQQLVNFYLFEVVGIFKAVDINQFLSTFYWITFGMSLFILCVQQVPYPWFISTYIWCRTQGTLTPLDWSEGDLCNFLLSYRHSLTQNFSNFNQHMNHLGILEKIQIRIHQVWNDT